jgi:DNA-binding transcriptional MerR regulator
VAFSSARDLAGVYSIGAVARMLDIPASTLRAWEERYSIITPARSEGSQRLYSRAQLEQLRFIKSQLEEGVSAADAHRVLAEQMRGGEPSARPHASDEARPLILIVERDPYAAELAEHFLRTEGYNVEVALDGEDAKRKFAGRAPDAVIVDLLISGGAGFRLLGEFAQSGTTQILAVAAIDAAGEAMRGGAAAFMQKPLESLKLVAAVRDLLGTSAVVRPSRQPA